MTKKEIIAVDESKLVKVLGRGFALPVEVVPFAAEAVLKKIEAMGARVVIRAAGPPAGVTSKKPSCFLTDNGNVILDCKFEEIPDPARLEKQINELVGVVENGLFVGLAHVLCVGKKSCLEAEVRIRPER
jgi:ribose 5-phosphate isomerase A